MSDAPLPGQDRESRRTVLRSSLADQMRRHAAADGVVRKDPMRFAEWVSVDPEESESARRIVEPGIVELRVQARRIGDRRGRIVALAWSIPVAVLLVALAVAVLITHGGA